MNSIKGVIFDLDGTLLDTITDLTNSMNKMLRILDYPTLSEKELMDRTGQGIKSLIENYLPEELGDEYRADAVQLYKNIYATEYNKYTAPYPGIIEMLNELYNDGIQIAVLSNKDDTYTKKLIASHFAQYEWIEVIGSKETKDRKPNPDNLIKIIKKMGLNINEVVMVGDTKNDIEVAKRVGIKSVAVSWGFRDVHQLEIYAPDYLIDDPNDLIEIIKY